MNTGHVGSAVISECIFLFLAAIFHLWSLGTLKNGAGHPGSFVVPICAWE
jgi:hypothetical protein